MEELDFVTFFSSSCGAREREMNDGDSREIVRLPALEMGPGLL